MEHGEVAITPNVVYGMRNDVTVSFDVYRPQAANGAAILFINSGGFISGQIIQYRETGQSDYRFLEPRELTVRGAPPPIPLLAQFSFAGLLARGFTVFDVRHANHPPSMLHDMVEDVHSAARFIHEHARDYSVDPSRLGVWGASAGGYLALHLGLGSEEVPFAAIATYYPAGFDFAQDVAEFPDLAKALPMLGLDSEALDVLSLKHLVHRDAPPVVVIYGEQDMPFITEPCRNLCRELQASAGGVLCIAIPGTGHEFRGEDGYHEQHGTRAQSEMVAWFARHLGG